MDVVTEPDDERSHSLPLPIVSLRKPYHAAYRSRWHRHERHQLLYAASGLMLADTETAKYLVPPGHGLFIPAGMQHQVTMIEVVEQRSLYIGQNELEPDLVRHCRTIGISPLLALLIDAFSGLDNPFPLTAKAHHLTQLLLIELSEASETSILSQEVV